MIADLTDIKLQNPPRNELARTLLGHAVNGDRCKVHTQRCRSTRGPNSTGERKFPTFRTPCRSLWAIELTETPVQRTVLSFCTQGTWAGIIKISAPELSVDSGRAPRVPRWWKAQSCLLAAWLTYELLGRFNPLRYCW
ncbi:hypothetical protein CEXT_133661 [Caerostris extrusa]|uniref:Uncharacterized protein n=1 Tax=Caerostris extrusa TaxID=172846 RepID=A0AAV4SKB3_CAEEX|nr:hypothetical protein CEXT_133661 [Caerostris extrusa]